MEIEKEVFEYNNVRLEVQHLPHGDTQFWLQVGIAGFYITPEELADLHELVGAFIEEVVSNDV